MKETIRDSLYHCCLGFFITLGAVGAVLLGIFAYKHIDVGFSVMRYLL